MNWPFKDQKNTAVITSVHVIKSNHEIVYVSHDIEDGMWQFLSADIAQIEDAMVVSLQEIFELDTTLGILCDLPLGFIAQRENRNSDWVISKEE